MLLGGLLSEGKGNHQQKRVLVGWCVTAEKYEKVLGGSLLCQTWRTHQRKLSKFEMKPMTNTGDKATDIERKRESKM